MKESGVAKTVLPGARASSPQRAEGPRLSKRARCPRSRELPKGTFTADNYSEAYAFNVQQPRLPGVQVSHSKRNPAPSNLP